MSRVNPWKWRAYAAATLWLLAVCLFAGLYAACAGTGPKVAISAADVVNEVARRGDQTYSVSVDSCHAAEKVAAELPNLAEAERAVGRIRSACDRVFRLLDEVRLAIAQVDEAMARAEAGQLPLRDVVSAALSARALLERAQAEDVTVAAQLQKGGP